MPEITLTISVPEIDDADSTDVESLLSDVRDLELEHGATIHLTDLHWKHPNWDWNDPCPACNGDLFHCEELDYSLYRTGKSGMTFVERADPPAEQALNTVMCDNLECEEMLYRGPASFLTHPTGIPQPTQP